MAGPGESPLEAGPGESPPEAGESPPEAGPEAPQHCFFLEDDQPPREGGRPGLTKAQQAVVMMVWR